MDGCRCRECYGLREYMLEHTGRHHDLPTAPGHLTVALHELDQPVCSGILTCPCPICQQERVASIHRHRQQRQRPPRQPWETRAA